MKVAAALVLSLAACGSNTSATGDDGPDQVDAASDGSGDGDAPASSKKIRTVFVIPLENKDDVNIYGNMSDAPYINGLFANANHAMNFKDELPSLDSEPHYVWMEAGTNVFSDRTFTTDNDSSMSNSTSNTEHLVAQLDTAGVPWMSYQEDMVEGECPIASSSFTSSAQYAAKHDPFVFFQDVAGSPPRKTSATCIAHHKPYSKFAADLAGGQLTGFVFITPNLCHDMHGALTCPSGLTSAKNVKAGDTWLSTELPRIITYAQAHDGVIFLVWDEGSSGSTMPFVALGSHVTSGVSTTMYTHSSLLATTEKIFGVPVLPTVANANDFADMFEPGTF
jgi:hypothetical protein